MDFDVMTQKLDVKKLLTVSDLPTTTTMPRKEFDIVSDEMATFNLEHLPILPVDDFQAFASQDAQDEYDNMRAITLDTMRHGAQLLREHGHKFAAQHGTRLEAQHDMQVFSDPIGYVVKHTRLQAQKAREAALRTYNYTVD